MRDIQPGIHASVDIPGPQHPLVPLILHQRAGGRLKCSGDRCQVVFRGATFNDCQLLARRGATVYLHGGHLQALPQHEARGILCAALDQGTTVHASGTTFAGKIAATNGGAFAGNHVHVRLESEYGIAVAAAGAGSSLTLRHCDIASAPDVLPAKSIGVAVHDKGVAIMTDCTVEKFGRCVQMHTGADASLLNCRIVASKGDGLWVMGSDTTIRAAGCSLEELRGAGDFAAVATANDVAKANISLNMCTVGSRRTFLHKPSHKSYDGPP